MNMQQKIAILKRARAVNPGIYRRAITEAFERVRKSRQMNGLGAVDNWGGLTAEQIRAIQDAEFVGVPDARAPNVFTDIINQGADILSQWGTAWLGIEQAKTCLEINKQRASQGLPAIDCGKAGLAPQVNVGVSQDVKMMGYIAIGAAVLGLYFFARKGR